jgi:pSer/pThr/pTyr-binding forkhead associated (FHA) protein
MEEVAKEPTAARRFAVGLIKVTGIAEGDEESGFELNDRSTERGKTHFMPINSRVSLGRDQNNDIYLYDATLKSGDDDRNRELSRFQCGFVTDLADVVVEDYLSANGTFVEDLTGSVRLKLEEDGSKKELKFVRMRERMLADGDHILVGPFVLRFVKLKPNEMLAR